MKKNNAYDEAYLCQDCIDEKKDKQRQLRNMDDNEVRRNIDLVRFLPC